LEPIERTIRELLEEKFQTEEYKDCFVVEIRMGKNAHIQVFMDCEQGVDLEKCGQISRHLEAWLDESQVLGEKYTLEVSSPGVDRPLIKRQYPKNIGRHIQIKRTDGDTVTGKLVQVDETRVGIEWEGAKKETKFLEIGFDEIQEAIIIVRF